MLIIKFFVVFRTIHDISHEIIIIDLMFNIQKFDTNSFEIHFEIAELNLDGRNKIQNRVWEHSIMLAFRISLFCRCQLMFVGAALVGLAAAPLWTAKATYLNHIARYHSQHKKQTHGISVSLFFGIFFAIFGTHKIWGNLISYFVLNQSSNPQIFNCGIDFDPQLASPINTTQDVNDTTVNTPFWSLQHKI